MNGRLWHGINGMAGELGHFNVESEGHPCGCGSRGCLEQYASATAIVRMAHEAIDSGNAPDLADFAKGNVEFTSRSIYQLAIQGHPSAQKIYQRVGRALAIGIGSMINALNLPMYVIGGGVSSAWDAFAPTMFEELKVRSFIYSHHRARPRPAGTEAHRGDHRADGQRCRPVRRGAPAHAAGAEQTETVRSGVGLDFQRSR